MKIKIKNLQIKSKWGNMDLKDMDFEGSKEEIDLFLSEAKSEYKLPPLPIRLNYLYYSGDPDKPIEEFNKVYILPSEDCVRNTDKIKYDERIDGQEGVVCAIDVRKNQVVVSMAGYNGNFIVHGHWLKYIGPNGSKNNP